MKNFDFNMSTNLMFGKDRLDTLAENILKYTSNTILLTYGGGSIKRSGLYDTVVSELEKGGVAFIELSGIKPNPEVSTARKGIEIIKENNIDFILAVGGGSVLDNSKHMAYGAAADADIWDLITSEDARKTFDESKVLKIGTIITLAATGSEMNNGGVMTNPDENLKLGFGHSSLLPVFTYEDPTQLYTLPNYQRKAGLSDIMSHLLEVYFDGHEDSYIDDRMVEAIMKNIIAFKDDYLTKDADYLSCSNVFYSSTLALNGLTRMGREGADWLSHGLEHEVSAYTDLTHGIGLAIIHPAVLTYYYNKDINEGFNTVKFENLAVNVFDYSRDESELAKKGLENIVRVFKEIAGVTTLSEVEITDFNFERSANKVGNTNGYHELTPKDYVLIYESIK